MSIQANLKPGAFCWVELLTRDTAGARKFYGDLMGWRARDVPTGSGATYTMLMKGERPVAGMMALPEEMQGAPPCWMSHVYVTDLDARAERAASLGGRVLNTGTVEGMGRFAVVADPTGAVLCLWQPNGPMPGPVYQEPGGLAWNELWTADPEKAVAFYQGLFGWAGRPHEMAPSYTVFVNDGQGCGGMMPMSEEAARSGAPPLWMVYLGVEEADASVERAVSLGARVLAPPTDIPKVGRFAVLADPQGAAFAILEMRFEP